ncbi:Imm1 family immunity protein [Kitasatospora sp. NPDC056783]|uniref:Imm1 family immunity protein n=1 Tax=Kitasatospora sp. NPDC056783 TaxID=3345943 RepID=UPI0036BF64EA
MILTVQINHDEYRPGTRGEEDGLIERVIKELDFGENASFVLDANRPGDHIYPDSVLTVSINRSTGYGGAVWYSGENYPKQGGIYESVWVSDNPSPPEIDPKVLSDVHVPVFMDPASVIPLSSLRQVIEEFCRAKTGDRPCGIQWVKGRIGGERLDRAEMEPVSETHSGAHSLMGALRAHFWANGSAPS